MSGRGNDERMRLLELRARELARPLVEERESSELTELTTFLMGGQVHAIQTRHVLTVARPGRVALLPGARSYVLGAASIGGELVLVADLRPLLGLSAPPATDQLRWLVCGETHPELAIIAESVEDSAAVFDRRIEAPAWLTPPGDRRPAWVRGVTHEGWIVLDGESLLEDPRLYLTNSSSSMRAPLRTSEES